jgi:sulfur carrier protein
VNVQLNGANHVLSDNANVADAVSALTAAERGVAVALNGEVVPRTEWQSTRLREGDRLEVLTAKQGG